jgi:hypothetical protein
VSRQVVERDEVPDHADRLVEGAVPIVRRVAVLLEEVVLQQLGHLEGDLVRLSQRRFADELESMFETFFVATDSRGRGVRCTVNS